MLIELHWIKLIKKFQAFKRLIIILKIIFIFKIQSYNHNSHQIETITTLLQSLIIKNQQVRVQENK